MGQNNRQRRAAKQRQRAQKHRGRNTHTGNASADFDHEVFAAGAASLLLGRALRHLARGNDSSFDLLDFQRCPERHQQSAIDEQFAFAVDGLIEAGWTPLDLYEVIRRKTAGAAVTHLLDVVAEATAQHPAHLVHPQWRGQLDRLGAAAGRDGGLSPSCAWGRRSGLDWASTLEHLLSVLVVVCSLPVVARVLPTPGSNADYETCPAGVDGKVLRRVRGLLAKAESTEHPEEADALTAKAQELMSRYAIERAIAESGQPAAPDPVCRRLWLDNPYVDAKTLLVEAVADANNCRSIQSSTWGFVAIVGHPADLDVVELLVTSLLVQANRAMTLAGRQLTRHGASRTRSFRQSLLVAYAGRIGERLTESAHATEASCNGESGGVLVPVLTARRHLVEGKVTDLFPELVERRVSVSNPAGWGAGRAAADLALFDVHDSVTSRAG